ARRLEPDLHAVRAEVALGGRVADRVDVDRVVGAGLDAGLAADAHVLVEVDDPVRAAVHGRGRADRHAGRVLALVAAQHPEVPLGRGAAPLLDLLDPGAEHPQGDVVLRLAGHAAGVAADAAVVIDELAPQHGRILTGGCGLHAARAEEDRGPIG